MAFKPVIKLEALWNGEMKGMTIDGQKIVLINQDNRIYAFEDRCLHLGVELSKGTFEKGILTCYAHHWQYDATNGCGINPKNSQLKMFAVKIVDGDIFVDINQDECTVLQNNNLGNKE